MSPNIIILQKNLFLSSASVLVCTANTVGVMGAGVAKEFRERHPDLYYRYKQLCRRDKFNHKTLMVFQPSNARYRVIMAPTKRHWTENSRLEDVEATIRAMARWCIENKISTIAMPPLGCGNGGLDFDHQVKPIIEKYFGGIPTNVHIHIMRKYKGWCCPVCGSDTEAGKSSCSGCGYTR